MDWTAVADASRAGWGRWTIAGVDDLFPGEGRHATSPGAGPPDSGEDTGPGGVLADWTALAFAAAALSARCRAAAAKGRSGPGPAVAWLPPAFACRPVRRGEVGLTARSAPAASVGLGASALDGEFGFLDAGARGVRSLLPPPALGTLSAVSSVMEVPSFGTSKYRRPTHISVGRVADIPRTAGFQR